MALANTAYITILLQRLSRRYETPRWPLGHPRWDEFAILSLPARQSQACLKEKKKLDSTEVL